MNLIEIMTATQKTVDAFQGKTFKDGKFDCIQLTILHARHMGKRIAVPPYGDLESAAKVLRELGFKTLGQAMDYHFDRLTPHEAMMGDFVEMPGSNGFSSISVAVGNGRALGFHEDIPHCDIIQPVLISGVWRVGESA